MKTIVLFSQAPADIQYVLSLYDKYKYKFNIKIVVVNVKNNFRYLKSLKLKVELKFVPLIPQKDIIKFLKYSIKLKFIYKNLFSRLAIEKVYFFSNNYDYVTAYFIEKLQYRSDIFFYDIYKINGENIINTVTIIKKNIIKLLFGINIKFFNLPPSIAYQYIYDRKKVKEIDLRSIVKNLNSYKYNISKTDSIKMNLLLFESNGETSNDFVNYNQDMINILDTISNDYNIYIKPHPRLGYSKICDNYNINIIKSYIPSELVSLNRFDLVLGIDSAAIATSNHHNNKCILELFNFYDKNRLLYIQKYLEKLSKNRLLFVKSVKELNNAF
jgi:hypothetical protein